jgi:hypothetical protein
MLCSFKRLYFFVVCDLYVILITINPEVVINLTKG